MSPRHRLIGHFGEGYEHAHLAIVHAAATLGQASRATAESTQKLTSEAGLGRLAAHGIWPWPNCGLWIAGCCLPLALQFVNAGADRGEIVSGTHHGGSPSQGNWEPNFTPPFVLLSGN